MPQLEHIEATEKRSVDRSVYTEESVLITAGDTIGKINLVQQGGLLERLRGLVRCESDADVSNACASR